jgi:DNA-directed RNA polymerase specialized sigma24 family protein
MQTTESLNDLYTDFSAGLLDMQQFEGAIFRVIQRDIRCHGLPGVGRDDGDDYISWLYPRIKRAIATYRENGSSFETYIGAMIRLTAIEYRSRQARVYAAEAASWITQMPDMYAREHEPQYGDIAVDTEKPVPIKKSRQHLILVLKCCNYVSEDFLERIVPALGIEPEVLRNMVNRLKKMREKREKEIQRLQESVNFQFFRNIFYERCLRSIPDDSVAARHLKELHERGRTRLKKKRKLLASQRSDPSNKQIADVLGIAKVTVDSALHYLKKRGVRHADFGYNEIILN